MGNLDIQIYTRKNMKMNILKGTLNIDFELFSPTMVYSLSF